MFATSLGGRKKEEDGGGGMQGCQEKVTAYLHPRTCSICEKIPTKQWFFPEQNCVNNRKNVSFSFPHCQPCVKEEAG